MYGVGSGESTVEHPTVERVRPQLERPEYNPYYHPDGKILPTPQTAPEVEVKETAKKATFDRCVIKVLDECRSIAGDRGAAYCDSWGLEHLSGAMTASQLKRFGITLTPEQLRLVLLAAVVDVKHSRIVAGGAFKRDNHIDAINYQAVWAQLSEEYEDAHNAE